MVQTAEGQHLWVLRIIPLGVEERFSMLCCWEQISGTDESQLTFALISWLHGTDSQIEPC